ncbi:hypothetical protein FE697_015335 [Mumia zhuanghuii]|uniref:Phage-related minor tail protein n=2 Tax=Mumia TaxID=1546255 RepID=A0ABW1QR76_9ACTN|nr:MULTISPECIES: hypothetical protein [Mumia]KAA1422505.1 hypothetical protein FE697_015335 [Mumia zhuanghuii]
MTSRSVLVRLKGDTGDFDRALAGASAKAKAFAGDLDASSDRMSNLVQTALALGPALVPIGAAAIPALAGLTTQFTAAAGAAGVAVLAFSGVGDALEALNDYELEPSAANLEQLNEAMAKLGPAGRDFARFLQEIRPEMQGLQDVAQAGLFPGLEDGITALMTRGPEVEGIISEIADTMGDLARAAGESLASDRWTEFFEYVRTQARPTLTDMGYALGDVTEGLADLMMAVDPLSDDFSSGMRDAARSFREWADGVSETEGFQEFLTYVQRVGPEAMSTLGSIGNALLQVVEAAAPVGEASLPVIRALANTIAAVADSPAGPVLIAVAAGISAVSRAVALYNAAQGSALMGLLGGGKDGAKAGAGYRAAGAGIAALALSMTDLDEKLGVSNTAMLATMGLVAGPWGAAIGAGAGLALDFAASNDDIADSITRLNDVIGNESTPVQRQIKEYEEAQKALDEYKRDVEGFWSTAFTFKGQKNAWEDTFGRSDVEEMQAELDKLEKKLTKAKGQTGVDAQAKIAAEQTADAFDMLGDSASSAADQAQGLADALYAVIDPSLEADKAALAAKEGWAGLVDTLAKTKGAYSDTSKAGLESQIALKEQAKATIEAATSQFALDGNTQKLTRSLVASRDRLVEVGAAAGIPLPKMRALADEMFNVPDLVETTVRQNGAEGARSRVEALRKAYNLTPKQLRTLVSEAGANPTKAKVADLAKQYKLTPKQVTTIISAQDQATPTIRTVTSALASIPQTVTSTIVVRRSGPGGGGGMTSNADGSVTDYYANGGMRENHVAQIAPAGAWRVWAEPETGGEAYIPLAASKRDRSIDIWTETGRRLGMLESYANGDVRDALQGFKINPRMDRSSIRSEVRELLRGLDDAVGRNSRLFKAADRLGDRLDRNAKALDKNRERLERVTSARADLIGDVRGNLTHDPFGGGLSDFRTQTDADRNDATAFRRALATARGKGLDGTLFRDLAAKGNLALVQEFAGLSRGQIEREEVRYRGAQSAINSAATFAGNATYGKEIARLNRTQDRLEKSITRLDKKVDQLPRAVKQGSKEGSKEGAEAGTRDGQKNQAQKARGRRG